MTRIQPGVYKGPEFKAGQEITAGDVCRLQQMGRNRVYVQDESSADGMVHENEAAQAFADRMAGEGIVFKAPRKKVKSVSVQLTKDCFPLTVIFLSGSTCCPM